MLGVSRAALTRERTRRLGRTEINHEASGHDTGGKDDHGSKYGFPSVHHVYSKSTNEASITVSKSVDSGSTVSVVVSAGSNAA